MFIYFRLSGWFGVAGFGPAQPYRQSSVSPVYLRVKVGNMDNLDYTKVFVASELVLVAYVDGS